MSRSNLLTSADPSARVWRRILRPGLWAGLVLTMLLTPSCQEQRFDLDSATIEQYRTRAVAEAKTRTPAIRAAERAWATSQPTTQLEAPTTTVVAGSRTTPKAVTLSLQETINRALAHSLDIKVESYTPAISAMDIVTAEAAFDAVLFLESQWTKLDDPSNSTSPFTPLPSSLQSDERRITPGIRKKLATGGEISASVNIDRTINNQPFQRFDPFYNDNASIQLTQPLLRNFGVDVNRAQTYVARNNRNISLFTFRRKVIETLAAVEQGYWNLFFARQSLAIQRELLAQTEKTYNTVWDRRDLDATPPIIAQTLSAVASRRASVSQLAAEVQNAEDRLKNLLDDPALPLGQDVAILLADDPVTAPLELDPEREFWAAMENRSELQEARLAIANANIAKGVAGNQRLPQLDLSLQWNVNGLKSNFPDTNRQILRGDFQDYIVGVTFTFPLGNRAAEAGFRKTQLQLEQAVVNYHNMAAGIMTDVQIALRAVKTNYQLIQDNREAVITSEDTLAKLEARVTGLTPEFLDLRLRSQEAVGQSRRALQQAVADYNNAIVGLERAKGTLLRYDRVELTPEQSTGR